MIWADKRLRNVFGGGRVELMSDGGAELGLALQVVWIKGTEGK